MLLQLYYVLSPSKLLSQVTEFVHRSAVNKESLLSTSLHILTNSKNYAPFLPAVVVHTCNPRNWEAEIEGL